MKKIIFKKTVLVMVLAITCFTCSESFLEETNPNNISTDSFWKTLGDLDTGLTSVYNALKNGNVLRTVDEYNRSDMTYPGWGRPSTTNDYYLQTFNNSSDAPNAKWAALYTGIFRANQVIAATNKLMGTFGSAESEQHAVEILAQARALRGLFYFYLHTGFNKGAVPIIDFVPENEAEFYQPISPENKVQEFYMADLEFALENLPTKEEYADNELGRITKGAAAALLGKSYLYDGDYIKAATYFKSVIEDYNYRLTPDIGSNFTTRDEFNEESILEIAYSLKFNGELGAFEEAQTSSPLNFNFAPAGTPAGYRNLYPALWLNMLYRNEKVDTKDPRNFVNQPVLQANGLPVLDANGNRVMAVNVQRVFSLRTSASIALPDDLDTPLYQLTSAQGAQYNNGEHSYWRKYTNWDITDSEKSISATTPRSGVNIRLIRLADVYLMYAECLIKGGTDASGVDEALRYINKVRRRSGVRLLGLSGTGEYPSNDHDEKTYTAKEVMNHLMYVERPLELSAEGNAIRFLDLRRWGILKQRFQELATKRYVASPYPFETKPESGKQVGDPGTKFDALIKEYDGTNGVPFTKWDNEHGEAATNYNDNAYGYWPIPSSEITANPKLYDTP
ncbi:RagB/SusD family nutrient uptake outer membrane protein [Mariniflexile maritimum]|uniref:RagB/SusD family nutrient uptake outer membrane protein n=1 Tax=Mariniflexile maritimum TaxID=2682493 RepID=UPI0012F676F8|nr:RagB/SusD family nutrient uptake outer membrane protein [Mariniflexile maritimum]